MGFGLGSISDAVKSVGKSVSKVVSKAKDVVIPAAIGYATGGWVGAAASVLGSQLGSEVTPGGARPQAYSSEQAYNVGLQNFLNHIAFTSPHYLASNRQRLEDSFKRSSSRRL